MPHAVPTTQPLSSGGAPALYVANVRTANIVRVDESGSPQLTLNGGISPAGIGVSSTGDVVVAGDRQNVLYFHPQSPTPFNGFTSSKICGADGVALDAADDVYVGDALCPTIHRFTFGTSGTDVAPQADVNWDKGIYGALIAFDVDASGDVFALTGEGVGAARYILAYRAATDASGNPSYPQTPQAIPAGSDFPRADGIAADASGNIYVVTGNNKLLEFDQWSAPPSASAGLDGLCNAVSVRRAVQSNGTSTRALLYVADMCGGQKNNGSQIVAYDVTDLAAPSPSPSPTPFTIAVNAPSGSSGITRTSTLAVDQSGGQSSGNVYVSTPLADAVSGYCEGCFSIPSVQLSLGYPGMDGIQALWFDDNRMYTLDAAVDAITVYPQPSKSASGTQSPVPLARIFAAAGSSLCGLAGIVADAQHNLLVTLACPNENYVGKLTLPAGAQGDQYLTVTDFINTEGACSAVNPLCNPQQMAIDRSGNLYVTNYGKNPDVTIDAGSVVKFAPSGQLEAIMQSKDIHNPSGIAIDPQGNINVLSNVNTGGQPEIAVFAPPANQPSPNVPLQVTPVRPPLSGPNTQIGAGTDTPFPSMQIAPDGTIYADEFWYILVFAPNASGNVAPIHTYQNASLTGGTGIALQP